MDEEKCHCGREIVVHKGQNADGSDFTRGLCQSCDERRCDADPLDCPYNLDGSEKTAVALITGLSLDELDSLGGFAES